MSTGAPPDRRTVLLQRRETLLRRSAELRGGLMVGSEALVGPLTRAGQAHQLWQWLLEHRRQVLTGAAVAAAVLALRRPRAALRLGWRWTRRLFVLRRTWSRVGRWVAPVLAAWLGRRSG